AGRLCDWASRRVEELASADLSGYVLKAASPSCGTSVPVENGEDAPGLFARALIARFPDLPVADERALADPAGRQAFVDRVLAYRRGVRGARPSARSPACASGDRIAPPRPIAPRPKNRSKSVCITARSRSSCARRARIASSPPVFCCPSV